MSEAAPATNGKSSRPSSNGKGSYRRRRSSGKGPRAEKPTTEETSKPSTPEGEAAPKRERPETVPVPEDLVGTTQTGTVVVTVRNRKFHFGFISLGLGEKAQDPTTPRIYFNPSFISEKGLNLYHGYEVTFEVGKDESDRMVAKNIALTENGMKIKEVRDAEAQARRAARSEERAAAAAIAAATKKETKKEKDTAVAATTATEEKKDGEGKKKKRSRKRKPKKPVAEGEAAAITTTTTPAAAPTEKKPRRTATFDISVEGDDSKKGTLSFTIDSSIGRLKSLAAKAVDASMDLSVYLITDEHPNGVFCTRAVLNNVGETGKLLLAPKREADNLESK